MTYQLKYKIGGNSILHRIFLTLVLTVLLSMGTKANTFTVENKPKICIDYNRKPKISAAKSNAASHENSIEVDMKSIVLNEDKLLLKIKYPAISGLRNIKVQEMINDKFKSLALYILERGKELKKEIPHTGGMRAIATLDCKITYNKKSLLSVVFKNYLFGGGAHGLYIQYAYSFNTETGQEYNLKDLFKNGVDYVSIINKEIARQNVGSNLVKKIPNIPDTIESNQEFYLSDSGLVIYYNDMPFVIGIPEFTIDYSIFRDLIKDKF